MKTVMNHTYHFMSSIISSFSMRVALIALLALAGYLGGTVLGSTSSDVLAVEDGCNEDVCENVGVGEVCIAPDSEEDNPASDKNCNGYWVTDPETGKRTHKCEYQDCTAGESQ